VRASGAAALRKSFNRIISTLHQALGRDPTSGGTTERAVGIRGALSSSRIECNQTLRGRHIARRVVQTGHFLKEIVMRNFMYSLTLAAIGLLQLAIVVVELTRA
jgi:hypothetical protein